MILTNNEAIFDSGQSRYANGGIIGLGPDLEVSEGYDGCFYSGDSWLSKKDSLSKEDLLELADFMIERWSQFKKKHI